MSIYLYCSAEGALKCIETLRFRVSCAGAFNDPFDCQPVLLDPDDKEQQSLLEKRVQARIDRGDLADGDLDWIRRMEEHNLARSIRHNRGDISTFLASPSQPILCFTRTAHHPLMWAHYADKHQGMLLEFDENHAWFGDELVNVVYSDVRPTLDHYKDTRNFRRLFFFKALEWSYEQEVRMLPAASKAVNKEKVEGHHKFYFAFQPDLIRSVTIGMRSREQSALLDVVGKLGPQGAHIKLRQAGLDRKDFRIVFTPIGADAAPPQPAVTH